MRRFDPTPEQINAAATVFKCMAWLQTVQPVVDNYQRTILCDLGWSHIEPGRSWMLPDKVFKIYNQRCKDARNAAKLLVENPDFCPLLVAKNLLSDAQGVLIDLMEPVTGIPRNGLLCLGLKEYHEYVELTLRLLAPYVKEVGI